MKLPTRGWNRKAREAFEDLQAIADAYGRGDVVLKRYHTGALSRINTAFRDACYASERRHGGRGETGGIASDLELHSLVQDIANVRAWLKKPLGFYSGSGFIAQLDGPARREKAEPHVLRGVRAVLADVQEWLPVARFVQKLPEPAEAKPVYKPPKASQAAMRQVHRLLTDLVEHYRLDVEKSIAKSLRGIVDQFLTEHAGRTPYDYFTRDGRRLSYGYELVTRCLQGQRKPYSREEWTKPRWKKDGRKWLAETAKRQADAMANEFIAKNMQKLGAIVDTKEKTSKLQSCTVRETWATAGAFEGTFHLQFRDGSSFDARNRVVYKVSCNLKPFCQYPTTFHEVVWADGRTARKQSEKQMNEEWA